MNEHNDLIDFIKLFNEMKVDKNKIYIDKIDKKSIKKHQAESRAVIDNETKKRKCSLGYLNNKECGSNLSCTTCIHFKVF